MEIFLLTMAVIGWTASLTALYFVIKSKVRARRLLRLKKAVKDGKDLTPGEAFSLVQCLAMEHATKLQDEIGEGAHVIVLVGKDMGPHSYCYYSWKGTCDQVVGLFRRCEKQIAAL